MGSAPLLNAHKSSDLSNVIGVVERARVSGGQGVATVRFAADDPAAEPVWNKVRQGIIRNVSVGYTVHKYEKTTGTDGSMPTLRAIDWEPFEISLVPMGADAAAVVRGKEDSAMSSQIVTPDTERERQRVAAILDITASLAPELADELIRSGATTEQASRKVLDTARARGMDHLGPRIGNGGARITSEANEGPAFRAAASDALVIAAGIPLARVHPATRDMMPSVIEIARTCLSRAGFKTTGSVETLIRTAMTTSDFPEILADSVGKALRTGFEEEPASHREWVRVVPVRDFKAQTRPLLGSAPDLAEVLELGEYTQGPMAETSEAYAIVKYGKIVALSWETLVNDDLGAFLRIVPAMGMAARRKEAETVYNLLVSNAYAGPTLGGDSTALFHSNHANITDPSAALDATVLNAGRVLLRKQTALGGGVMNLTPRFLIVSPKHETEAEQLLASATRIRTGSTEQGSDSGRAEWISRLTLVVEARLNADHAYLATSPAQVDTFELGVLEENMGGPTMDREDSFTVDRVAWKVRHVFAAAALDYRGMVRLDLTGS